MPSARVSVPDSRCRMLEPTGPTHQATLAMMGTEAEPLMKRLTLGLVVFAAVCSASCAGSGSSGPHPWFHPHNQDHKVQAWLRREIQLGKLGAVDRHRRGLQESVR